MEEKSLPVRSRQESLTAKLLLEISLLDSLLKRLSIVDDHRNLETANALQTFNNKVILLNHLKKEVKSESCVGKYKRLNFSILKCVMLLGISFQILKFGWLACPHFPWMHSSIPLVFFAVTSLKLFPYKAIFVGFPLIKKLKFLCQTNFFWWVRFWFCRVKSDFIKFSCK